MNQKLPLSIFIITKNEADRIEKTLQALLTLSNDIIVVDSGSTDGTQKICSNLGVNVIEHEFEGYGPQKRFAEQQCRHEWLFNIDADEVITKKLCTEIEELFRNGSPSADAYRIRIAEIFPGEGAPHPLAYALSPVRLYSRLKGTYSPSIVHDRVDLVSGAKIEKLKGIIHHFSIRSIGDQIVKLNSYTDKQVIDLFKNNKHVPVWRLFTEFPSAFFKAYILRRHCVRGIYGFMTAMNFAFYRWLRVAKYIEGRHVEMKKRG